MSTTPPTGPTNIVASPALPSAGLNQAVDNPFLAAGLKTRTVKGYGWKPDLPDHRDIIFNLSNRIEMGSRLPAIVDMEPQFPPAYDQLQLGSCTGNGWVALMEHRAIKQGEPIEMPSRLFVYLGERVIEGTVNEDAGAEIRDGAKVVANLGVPSEALWAYDISKFAVIPPPEVYAQAKKHEALQYQRLVVGGPGAPIRTALAQGFPVVFGFPVPYYFEQGWDPTADPLAVPTANDTIIGGHCVVLVGYDFSLTRFKVPVLKCRNSWGTSWGENGYFYMDAKWFMPGEALASDLWIVKKVM